VTAVVVGDVTVEVTMPLARDHGFKSWVFSPMTQDMWLLRAKEVRVNAHVEYVACLVHDGEAYDLPIVSTRAALRMNVARVVLGFEPVDQPSAVRSNVS
jgi:hypothetical protein